METTNKMKGNQEKVPKRSGTFFLGFLGDGLSAVKEEWKINTYFHLANSEC